MFHHFSPTEGVSIAQFQTGPDIFMLKNACFRAGGEEGINNNNPQASDICCRVVWRHTVPTVCRKKVSRRPWKQPPFNRTIPGKN